MEKVGDKLRAAAQETGTMARDAASSAVALASDAWFITAPVRRVWPGFRPECAEDRCRYPWRGGHPQRTAPSDAARERAAAIARDVKGVSAVINHLTV